MNSSVQFVCGLLVSESMGSEIRTVCVYLGFCYMLESYSSSLDFTETLPYIKKCGK